MANIYELVTAQNFTDFYIESSGEQQRSLGFALFPARKQLGLNLSFLKGRHGLPVVLKNSAFDANAPLRNRIGVTSVQMEMPFFRERYNIREIDRQQVNTFLQGGQTDQANAIIRFIFDDARQLIRGADAAAERMRMQLISEGKITIDSEGVVKEYDYGFDEDTQAVKLVGTNKWDDPSSNPIQDIFDWQKKVQLATGEKPRRAVMNSTTLSYLVTNNVIAQALENLVVFSDDDVKEYLRRKTGLDIAVYDDMYIDEDGKAQYYFPDNVVSLLPGSTLGYTNYGTTPEESDLLTQSDASVSIVNTGIAITTHKEVHPVSVQTIASQICLPSFESIDKLFIATVA